MASGGVFTPLHIGAVFKYESGERGASLGTIATKKPYTPVDRLRCPINKVGMSPQACYAAIRTGL
jgi:hypothetical protein